MLRNEPEPYLSFLLDALSSPLPHARALSALILRAYITRLSGPAQITTARRTINALGPNLSLAPALDDDVNAMLSDEGLGRTVSSKPKSAGSQAWLSASLLATCAAVLRPAGGICFITHSVSPHLSPPTHIRLA